MADTRHGSPGESGHPTIGQDIPETRPIAATPFHEVTLLDIVEAAIRPDRRVPVENGCYLPPSVTSGSQSAVCG